VHKILLKVREALVAYEILLRGECNKVSSLALASKELCVVGSGELNKTGEVVLAVELKKGLKGRKASEVEGSWLDDVNLGSLTLEHNLVLLVTGAQSKRVGQLSRDGEVTGIAEVVLGLGDGSAGEW